MLGGNHARAHAHTYHDHWRGANMTARAWLAWQQRGDRQGSERKACSASRGGHKAQRGEGGREGGREQEDSFVLFSMAFAIASKVVLRQRELVTFSQPKSICKPSARGETITNKSLPPSVRSPPTHTPPLACPGIVIRPDRETAPTTKFFESA